MGLSQWRSAESNQGIRFLSVEIGDLKEKRSGKPLRNQNR